MGIARVDNDELIQTTTPGENDKGVVVRPVMSGQSLGTGGRTVDAWGAQKVSLPYSVFHGMFTFDIPASMWFIFEDGVETVNTSATNVYSEGGAAHILGDATHPTALLESRECPRYQPDRGILLPTALVCPNPTNDGERTWGGRIGGNGAYFKLKNDGLLYACIESGGTETHEEVIDMEAIIPGWSADQRHTYDIQAQWRGMGGYTFFVDLIDAYEISFLGTVGTTVTIENPALPWHFQAKRTTEDVKIIVGCADITSENGRIDSEQYGSSYAENVSVNGTDAPVLVIHNPATINSEVNTRTITLARISVKCSKKATFKVWRTRDATAFTGMTLQEIQNGSTHVQTDSPDMVAGAVRATAIDTAKCAIVRPIPVEAQVETAIDNPYRGRIEFPVVRGDYIIVTCTASTATAEAVDEWGEQI